MEAPSLLAPTGAAEGSADLPRILVVDDAATVRLQLRQILSTEYRCVCVSSAEAALEECRKEAPDVIVSDVVMEPVDGYELLRRVRAEPTLTDIPFVLLTSQSDPDGRATGLEGGADDYLPKPVRAREILARVKSLVRLRLAQREILRQKEELSAAHDELLKAQKRLLDAEKLSTLGTLASGVAHEINNPLGFVLSGVGSMVGLVSELSEAVTQAGIPGMENALTDATDLQAEVKEGLTRIQNIVQKLGLLGDDGKEAAAQVIDVRAEIEQALTIAAPQMGRAELVRELGACRMKVRSGYLTQVALSLVTNALDAVQGVSEPRVAVRLKTGPGDSVELEVEDNGKGIPSELLPRIFEPFFTTKPAGKGTGLGLSVCYSLVKRLGGKTSVESHPGQTRFRVSLPPQALGVDTAFHRGRQEAARLA
ncbi:MAG TPA: ATP-binding protein [Myxococcaceae bacterium]|nr:ATP-binding protein [Myxococcaceae bacterium]